MIFNFNNDNKRNLTINIIYIYWRMLQSLIQQCKNQQDAFQRANFVLIEENQYQHSDFMVIGWMLEELSQDNNVTFITFRENYAHFLSLSKKLGKSIEGFIKNKRLQMIECFQSSFCSQLPLTQSSPQTYISPPSMVRKIYAENLMKQKEIFKEKQIIIVDSISFIEENVELCFWIYEQAKQNGCKLILGGNLEDSQLTKLLEYESDLIIRLQRDVGGHGKVSIMSDGQVGSVLWRYLSGRVQFSQHIAL